MTTGTNVITREELYDLVWSTPMIKVAEKFEVSGSYLARVCTELRVPGPDPRREGALPGEPQDRRR